MYLVEINMWVKQVIFLKGEMVNHISDIRRKKNGPVSRHINNNADRLLASLAEENIILYPIEQILDQG